MEDSVPVSINFINVSSFDTISQAVSMFQSHRTIILYMYTTY